MTVDKYKYNTKKCLTEPKKVADQTEDQAKDGNDTKGFVKSDFWSIHDYLFFAEKKRYKE